MAKRNNQAASPLRMLVAIVIIILGALIYAVTGVDLLGISTNDGSGSGSGSPSALPVRTIEAANIQFIDIQNGYGAQAEFWQVYFSKPLNTTDRSLYRNGIDGQLAAAINNTRNTLDIAAFELSNPVITEAIVNAARRGVQVRMVVDDEHVLEDDDSTISQVELAGISIVDDDRTALMHNKFMIMDGVQVWMGSMNFTQNGVYRNNNNAILLRSRRAVQAYQAEFVEMFERGEFGPRSSTGNGATFTQDGIPMSISFASEDDVVGQIIAEIVNARRSIQFMVFSFTRDDIGAAMIAKANGGVMVQGVFENTGSLTDFSEMGKMFCAGLDVRQDGNPGILHHKVIIIDESVVITGSFNFSDNAVESNDENLMIIRHPSIAQLYLQEFDRVRNIASRPTDSEIDEC